MANKLSRETESASEQERRRDDALRRALATPPKPHGKGAESTDKRDAEERTKRPSAPGQVKR